MNEKVNGMHYQPPSLSPVPSIVPGIIIAFLLFLLFWRGCQRTEQPIVRELVEFDREVHLRRIGDGILRIESRLRMIEEKLKLAEKE